MGQRLRPPSTARASAHLIRFGSSSVAALWAERTAIEQGVPPRVSDITVLRKVGLLVRSGVGRRRQGFRM